MKKRGVKVCDGCEPRKVAVVMVNYNGEVYIKKCLDSIYSQTYKNIFVVVVDNFSTDNSVKLIAESYKDIYLIKNSENLGFAMGNNIGIEYAMNQGADYILLLNVDTWIEKDMVKNLVRYASSKVVTVPRIYSDRRLTKVWYAGGEIDYCKGNVYHCAYKMEETTKKVSFACGCCALISVEIFKQIGMFDDKFYLYFEDADLSIRILQAGNEIRLVQGAKMWHRIGGTGGRSAGLIKQYYMNRNQLYFVHKHAENFDIGYIKLSLRLFWENVVKEYRAEKRKYAWKGIRDFYLRRTYRYRENVY